MSAEASTGPARAGAAAGFTTGADCPVRSGRRLVTGAARAEAIDSGDGRSGTGANFSGGAGTWGRETDKTVPVGAAAVTPRDGAALTVTVPGWAGGSCSNAGVEAGASGGPGTAATG